jgi:hypothetical protein
VTIFRRSKTRQSQKISPVSEAVRTINKLQPIESIDGQFKKPIFKSFLLPWWCVIIAYIISFLLMITSTTFIVARSVRIGDVNTRKWLTSVVSSFFASILLTQPFKVLAGTLLFICLCRKKPKSEPFLENDNIHPQLTSFGSNDNQLSKVNR